MENETLQSGFNTNGLKLPKDVGLYWIHCNRCYEIYVHKRRRIFLLACYHTICEVCVGVPSANAITAPNEVNCPLCKNVQRFRVLCNMMPAHFKELLNPEPWREPTERILTFQSNQRQSFKKGMLRKSTELEEIKKKCKLLEIKSKKKYERYEQLQYERKQLEREVRKLKEQELQQKNNYLKSTRGSTYSNAVFNMNTFPGVKEARTDKNSQNRGFSHSRNISNNSFTLCL